MEPVAWIASFSWPEMPPVGSAPVVEVWEDDHGLPPLLVDPLDVEQVPVPGRWVLDGKSTEERIAHYVLEQP